MFCRTQQQQRYASGTAKLIAWLSYREPLLKFFSSSLVHLFQVSSAHHLTLSCPLHPGSTSPENFCCHSLAFRCQNVIWAPAGFLELDQEHRRQMTKKKASWTQEALCQEEFVKEVLLGYLQANSLCSGLDTICLHQMGIRPPKACCRPQFLNSRPSRPDIVLFLSIFILSVKLQSSGLFKIKK